MVVVLLRIVDEGGGELAGFVHGGGGLGEVDDVWGGHAGGMAGECGVRKGDWGGDCVRMAGRNREIGLPIRGDWAYWVGKRVW